MNKILLSTALFLIVNLSWAQAPEEAFDFWVGEWDITYTNQKGEEIKAKNTITKVLDGKVIEENFEDPKGSGLLGKSISVYNPRTKTWHQAWADNQGSYFDFVGEIEGENRIFRTKMVEKDGKQIIQRMRFYDISEDSFVWDWESTTDNGKTWTLAWRLNYSRAN